MILRKIDSKLSSMLSERLKDEKTAEYFYNSATNWCRTMGYETAAKYFEEEAKSELGHFQMLSDYITGFNVNPILSPLSSPQTFTDLWDIIKKAYTMELGLMDAYNKVSDEAFDKDLNLFDFLKKMRDIQSESVIEYANLYNQYEITVDAEDKMSIVYFTETFMK